ncbi:YggT family protein [Candidatus Liberibacter solanacearum]|uniref:YggT family protein n=2 Tax=Candidatus Liberibacter solanacearum TaxID=556287 RepID=UPI00387297FE
MNFLFKIMHLFLELYSQILFINIIISFLCSYNIVNTSNLFVRLVIQLLHSITEPPLIIIRKIIPIVVTNSLHIDLSYLILLLTIYILQNGLIALMQ